MSAKGRPVKAAFGPETVAGQEAGLRKRCVPLVRREVRTVQGNLARALGEIESAARPIDALLSRREVRQTWTAQARRYMPLAAQGGSALAMVVLSHGTMGWSGIHRCIRRPSWTTSISARADTASETTFSH